MLHNIRLLNLSSPDALAREMARLGCDPAGVSIMTPKARRLLDWSPQISIEEGLRRTAAWYHEQHALASSVELGD